MGKEDPSDSGGRRCAGTPETRGCVSLELCANCFIFKSKDMEKAFVQGKKIPLYGGVSKSPRGKFTLLLPVMEKYVILYWQVIIYYVSIWFCFK